MNRLKVASPQEAVEVQRDWVKSVARAVLEGEGVQGYDVILAFVDNATIQSRNKMHLGHDEPTDVLSYPYSEPGSAALSGELLIGAEVALEQARQRGHGVEAELALYVIHGLLHLCGYDDHDEAEAARMRQRERHYLALLGLPDIAGE
jgi:probable rRNA maturation factor